MPGTIAPWPYHQLFDNNGAPLASGKLYVYTAGTSTPATTYSDSALTVPNANPIVLDAAGRCKIFLPAASFKFILKTSADVTVWEIDGVQATGLAAISSTFNNVCDGRLTLTSVTPVTTADVTAATTVYFTPYKGNRIALYDGSAWNIYNFSELSIALGSDAANLPYDVFAYVSAGAVAIERLAWTNGTTRATGLALQDGVLVKSGATTRRYLGTYYTTGVGQTEDSAAKRFVWNNAHRDRRPLKKYEATASWTYSLSTVRQANGAATNQVEAVIGWAESTVDVSLVTSASCDTVARLHYASIGEDSTTAFSENAQSFPGLTPVANYTTPVFARLAVKPSVGLHYYAWLEATDGVGVTTWNGTAATVSNRRTSGLTGWVEA